MDIHPKEDEVQLQECGRGPHLTAVCSEKCGLRASEEREGRGSGGA